MERLSTIMLAIVSAVTALSPMITTFMNNKHNLKMKKLEMYEKAKQDALKHFINAYSTYFAISPDEKHRTEALAAMHTLLIYFDIDNNLQNNMLEAFNNRRHKILHEVVNTLCTQIHKEVKP